VTSTFSTDVGVESEAIQVPGGGYVWIDVTSIKRDSNKTRDLYKRLELSLLAHGPRLTTMRRTTPLEYAVWIKKVEEFAREGRTEALNSFYGHTVVRERDKSGADKRNEKPKESPTPSPTPKSEQP